MNGNLIQAMWDIKEYCDQFPYGDCSSCPLSTKVRCLVGYPYGWNMTEIIRRIEGEIE